MLHKLLITFLIVVDESNACGVIRDHSLQLIKSLSGGMQYVEPLESWSMKIGRFGQARAAGGLWDREKHVWSVRYGCIAGTKLEKFIIVETPKDDIK